MLPALALSAVTTIADWLVYYSNGDTVRYVITRDSATLHVRRTEAGSNESDRTYSARFSQLFCMSGTPDASIKPGLTYDQGVLVTLGTRTDGVAIEFAPDQRKDTFDKLEPLLERYAPQLSAHSFVPGETCPPTN